MPRNKSVRNKFRHSKSKIIIIVLAVLLMLIGFWQYKKLANKNGQSATNGSSQTKTPVTTPSYETKAEGSTVTVPKDVSPNSIRNYELITENEQYKIRYNGSTYLITLYAIINNPSQYESYKNQLREYKQKALDYLTSKGIDVNKVPIEYEPKEAAQL